MKLRIGTLNVWGLPQPFGTDLDRRMRAAAHHLSELLLDVLVVQEAWTKEVRETLIEGGRRAGFVHSFVPNEAPGGGLIVLAKQQILDPDFERFSFRGDFGRLSGGEYLGGKGFVSFRLLTDAGPIRVIDTHLHARYRRNRPFLNSAVRTAQILQLVQAVRGGDEPVVLLGDFNCEAGDPEYQVLIGLTGLEDIAAKLDQTQATISRHNHYKRHRRGEDMRIDFAFLGQGAGVRVAPLGCWRIFDQLLDVAGDKRPASDHFGVGCNLELVSSPGATRPVPTPEPHVIELARRLLAEGRRESAESESAHVRSAGFWLAGAAAALAMGQTRLATRRSFVRRGLGLAAIASLAPAAGLTALARVDDPTKAHAFDEASAALAGIGRGESRRNSAENDAPAQRERSQPGNTDANHRA